ncbi:MAG TPA: TonB-dependent receptor plug domain-containing protein [Steroidobacteraceae bacterium]|jgi:outer membrane receptor protein involved in Fe transport|nr:TonB-dependent receptor plug domain-containing protein [Steroidobacteraceae bacterium]
MGQKPARFVARPAQGGFQPSPTRLAVAIAAALSGGAAIYPMMAAADAAGDSTAGGGAPAGSTLDEVIVTARKRAENLQDVPISIDVYTSKDLKNLAISQFEDYAAQTPSISFVSAGPGTQTFVMRGVSDGSNPNYSNESTTAYLVDDMSMNFYGNTPDLHLYDIGQIEVLNGPQGTTFGAGAMAGALRFTTNKPDASGFSAGIDTDIGKIDGGTHNGTIEGFVNIPLIADWTAIRLSGYNDYHGGYIDNLNVTRNWVNGTVSNNSQWAGRNYNVEKVTGGRAAIGQKIADGWKATLTASYQRQLTHGAWDENPTIGGAVDLNGDLVNGPVRSLGRRNVDRFGPEFKQYYTKTLDFHLDGDVGIGDLVYANTYWAQDDRWVNEYSEYMQYVNTGPSFNATTQQAYACLTDPVNGGGFSGCNVPTLSYDYRTKTDRWSNELRLQSKPGGYIHWLGGAYWEKTREFYGDYYHMPGLQTAGEAWQAATAYYYNSGAVPPKPDDWYSYNTRYDYLQTTEFANVTFDLTSRLHFEVGTVHFHSTFNTSTYGGYWYAPQTPASLGGSSNKWNSEAKLSYNLTGDALVYADWAQGFRDGGVNVGLAEQCVKNGAPPQFQPDTLTNWELGWKTTWLDRRLLFNGAMYYMPWKNYQTLLFDPQICAASSFNENVGDARIYGMESNVKFQPNARLSMGLSASYNDSRITRNNYYNTNFEVYPGERLPYVPYFNWSGNVRYELPIHDALHWYAQYDATHKGDMFNSLQATGTNGLPYVLQPGYTLMNLRAGLDQLDEHWTAELYITNLTNKNAVIYTNEGNFDLRQTVNEPRVFGMRLSYRFGKTAATTSED